MLSAVGPLTVHMAVHLMLMNAIAPAVALMLSRRGLGAPAGQLFPAMGAQLALLWMWHAPPLLGAAMDRHTLHLLMQISLLSAALWFWSALLSLGGSGRWRGLLALLLTSKIFCLLGVLFVFAPRMLYPHAALPIGHEHHALAGSLADQQLAGLLMLVVCPASYLTAGVVLAARWVFGIEASVSGNATRRIAAADAG